MKPISTSQKKKIPFHLLLKVPKHKQCLKSYLIAIVFFESRIILLFLFFTRYFKTLYLKCHNKLQMCTSRSHYKVKSVKVRGINKQSQYTCTNLEMFAFSSWQLHNKHFCQYLTELQLHTQYCQQKARPTVEAYRITETDSC